MLRLAATHAPTLTKQRAPLALLSVLLVHSSIDLGWYTKKYYIAQHLYWSALSKTPSVVYASQRQFWPHVENIQVLVCPTIGFKIAVLILRLNNSNFYFYIYFYILSLIIALPYPFLSQSLVLLRLYWCDLGQIGPKWKPQDSTKHVFLLRGEPTRFRFRFRFNVSEES